MFNDSLFGKWKWILSIIKHSFIHDLYLVYLVEPFITLNKKLKYIIPFSSMMLVYIHWFYSLQTFFIKGVQFHNDPCITFRFQWRFHPPGTISKFLTNSGILLHACFNISTMVPNICAHHVHDLLIFFHLHNDYMVTRLITKCILQMMCGNKHGQVHKKKVQCTKTIIFLVKRLKVIAKCCLNWIFFHDTLYCCVTYSIMQYQDDIFKTYH